jgi:hypothetical protein
MNLPKISYPTFDLEVPSLVKKFKFRPFVVREEKILLMAQQSGEVADIMNAIKQIINNCSVVQNAFDVNKLTTFDIEYLFVKLRSRSVSNIIKVSFTDPDTNERFSEEIDLEKIELKGTIVKDQKIRISDTLSMTVRYPSAEIYNNLKSGLDYNDALFETIVECIDKIYDKQNVFLPKDYRREDLKEFVMTLPVNVFNEIELFIQNMPRLHHEITFTNNLGEERVIALQTLKDFFRLG